MVIVARSDDVAFRRRVEVEGRHGVQASKVGPAPFQSQQHKIILEPIFDKAI